MKLLFSLPIQLLTRPLVTACFRPLRSKNSDDIPIVQPLTDFFRRSYDLVNQCQKPNAQGTSLGSFVDAVSEDLPRLVVVVRVSALRLRAHWAVLTQVGPLEPNWHSLDH